MKQFKQKLEYVLEDYYSTKSSLDPAILPLMTTHLDTVVRTFLPGWTTLTWSTMNIDAFLHRVESSVGTFKAMVTTMMDILREKVYGSLDIIRRMSLFDVDLAVSRMWVGNRGGRVWRERRRMGGSERGRWREEEGRGDGKRKGKGGVREDGGMEGSYTAK